LVDGGVADNLGMRSVLDTFELIEALSERGERTPFDGVRRIIVFVVNSISIPPTDWDMSEEPPGPVATMLKSSGTPIDLNSFENVEQLKDLAARWRTMRMIANSKAIATNDDPALAKVLRVPMAEIYSIDVSFAALDDKAEFDYLNQQPTTFVLPPEAVDRLRAAPAKIIPASREYQRFLNDMGATVAADPQTSNAPKASATR
jgi:NTE family protein